MFFCSKIVSLHNISEVVVGLIQISDEMKRLFILWNICHRNKVNIACIHKLQNNLSQSFWITEGNCLLKFYKMLTWYICRSNTNQLILAKKMHPLVHCSQIILFFLQFCIMKWGKHICLLNHPVTKLTTRYVCGLIVIKINHVYSSPQQWGSDGRTAGCYCMSHSPLIGSMWRWNQHHNLKTMTTVNHVDWQVAAASVPLHPCGWQELPSAPGEVRQHLHVRPSIGQHTCAYKGMNGSLQHVLLHCRALQSEDMVEIFFFFL